MRKDYVVGLRIFLLYVLRLISDNEQKSLEYVFKNSNNGIATALAEEYPGYFNCCFGSNEQISVDSYYREKITCDEYDIEKHYMCSENDGLAYLIALALDEI